MLSDCQPWHSNQLCKGIFKGSTFPPTVCGLGVANARVVVPAFDSPYNQFAFSISGDWRYKTTTLFMTLYDWENYILLVSWQIQIRNFFSDFLRVLTTCYFDYQRRTQVCYIFWTFFYMWNETKLSERKLVMLRLKLLELSGSIFVLFFQFSARLFRRSLSMVRSPQAACL